MVHFNPEQKKELKSLASQFRRGKIDMQHYHNYLQKFYS